MAKHGFDCTHFGDEFVWYKLCQETGLKFFAPWNDDGVKGFEWRNERSLVVVTQNNPGTGEYGPGTHLRPDDRGFASYIGIEGSDYEVCNFACAVRRYAASIKDEYAGERAYI